VIARDLGIMAGAFALAVVAALVAGAANLGTALGVGQLAFLAAATWVILRR
jgi:hypothetical protein